ncbi:site-specific integrase [Vagococcus sp.]|uniref:site-specific integrase n=1 Tax=Vagococcus sp. TaxID=1933889 RepID=UPI0010E1A23E|nr:site-specific integrase [Listeria monocytogenes]EAD4369287.1 site-specific integrase [Listeria monocytogenes]
MANIIKRGESWRVTISLYKFGKHNRLTKTFKTKKDATNWALKNELAKGTGQDLANRDTPFAIYFENWINTVKKNDVREATFINYQRTSSIITRLFGDIKLKNLNDIVVQSKIDEYAETHSRKTTTEVVLKIRTSLRYAYARGLINLDFASLVKTRGIEAPKKNRALSITEFKLLRQYLLRHMNTEFNILVLLALETGMRRGELLGIRPDDLYHYGIKVRRSLSPVSEDVSLKTEHSKREVSINKEIFQLVKSIPIKSNGYIFDNGKFHQSKMLSNLLKKIGIEKTTFHGLRDTHASFLFSQDISLEYVSKRLGHNSVLTTQNYYLQLMPEKKHQQDADALNLLDSLSKL